MHEQKAFIRVLTSLKQTSWKSSMTSRPDQDFLSKAPEGCSQFSINDDYVENDILYFVNSTVRWNEPVDNMLKYRAFRSD